MSYAHGGTYFGGLGASMAIDVTRGDTSVKTLQEELQRLGFLQAGTSGPTGNDGKWGYRTQAALQAAAAYVGYTDTPFTVSGTEVSVPDELVLRLQQARPAPVGTPGLWPGQGVPVDAPTSPVVPSGPGSATVDQAAQQAQSGSDGTVPMLLVGAGFLAVAGLAYYAMQKTNVKFKKHEPSKYHRHTKANRRRRRR